MDAILQEIVARKLYEQWCDNFGDPFEPEWEKFASGADLNPVGLKAGHFMESAGEIAPFDSAEQVARRMCLNNGIPECHGAKGPPCAVETCIGWREWLPYAEQIMDLSR